jgi:VanZ family protein
VDSRVLRTNRVDRGLRALTVAVGLGVLVGSLGPPPPEDFPFGPDKVLHFASYFLFTFLALLAFVGRPGGRSLPVEIGYAVVVCVIATGALIEFVQVLVSRDLEFLDVLANATGASLALVLWLLVLRRRS